MAVVIIIAFVVMTFVLVLIGTYGVFFTVALVITALSRGCAKWLRNTGDERG